MDSFPNVVTCRDYESRNNSKQDSKLLIGSHLLAEEIRVKCGLVNNLGANQRVYRTSRPVIESYWSQNVAN